MDVNIVLFIEILRSVVLSDRRSCKDPRWKEGVSPLSNEVWTEGSGEAK